MDKLLEAKSVLIIQPENPDGDSLASSLALDRLFYDMNKEALLFCPVNMPRYLQYIPGWDRVQDFVDKDFDASIIVDTSSQNLVEKMVEHPAWSKIKSKPIYVIDHHDHEPSLDFEFINLSDRSAAATSEVIYDLALKHELEITEESARYMIISIMADTLGMNSVATTPKVLRTVASLMEYGINLSDLEAERRKSMIRSAEITEYKGRLLQRIEYYCDGKLALITIPWEEIEEYSDKYNPSVLVIEEMRLTEGVELAVALKSYDSGRITGKLRANNDHPNAAKIAEKFGGGGHPYAAGFKVQDMTLDEVKKQLILNYNEIKDEVI